LKSLFSAPRLPDNPYYYLANFLGAYVDQVCLHIDVFSFPASALACWNIPSTTHHVLQVQTGHTHRAMYQQNALWRDPDATLLAALDGGGGLEVADADTRLCKLACCTQAWGLPHVLRLVAKEGERS